MAQNEQPNASCEDLSSRISKRDLFACLALWMEQSPLVGNCATFTPSGNPSPSTSDATDQPHSSKGFEKPNAVGVVIVDSAETIVSVECTRNFLHGVQRALIDSHGRLKESVVYASRKPCSRCTKLMIFAGVSRVFYLPFEPECSDEADMDCVEKLFRSSPVAQSMYLPNIKEKTIEKSKSKQSPYASSKANHEKFIQEMLIYYWNDSWRESISSSLKFSEYESSRRSIDEKIDSMIKWICEVTYGDVPDDVTFHADHRTRNSETSRSSNDDVPTQLGPDWRIRALHWSRMAQMLSQRSDDPKRGVGAVITKQNQIVAVGWNGYLPKAQLGDFPRASHHDNASPEKRKYPFSIHAEQSAILRRNTREIADSSTTIYVSKKPCDECVPFLVKTGIRNAVYPSAATPNPTNNCLTYHLIHECIRTGKIRGFQSTQSGDTNEPDNSGSENSSPD